MTQTPDHRSGFAARSGDTHVIGEDGVAVNVDRLAREAAAPPALAERSEAAPMSESHALAERSEAAPMPDAAARKPRKSDGEAEA